MIKIRQAFIGETLSSHQLFGYQHFSKYLRLCLRKKFIQIWNNLTVN